MIIYLSIVPVLYKIDAPFAERTISEIVFLNLVSKSVINLGAVTLSLHIYMYYAACTCIIVRFQVDYYEARCPKNS